MRISLWQRLLLLLGLGLITACGGSAPLPALPLRSDMPLDGMQQVVTYNLAGPANSDQLVNQADLRGVNDFSPERTLQTTFNQMSGTKTQDVTMSLPDGRNVQALGMTKTQRGVGLTHYLTGETATYWATDSKGNILCSVKVRLDFMRNLAQIVNPNYTDFDSLWYYDVPCDTDKTTGQLVVHVEQAKLRALVLNEVWQFRIGWGSIFWNWGHSVTSIGGPAAMLPGGWWGHIDIPGSSNDLVGAANLMNQMVKDLEGSSRPWIDFKSGSVFDKGGAYLIYTAGDADQYATLNRIFLNRQNAYVVAYRPDRATPWDSITIQPDYDLQWNDIGRLLAKANSWGTAPFNDKIDSNGLPKDPNDPVISELQRVGWMNAPNTSLNQIRWVSSSGHVNYSMTVRAYVGAKDTLVLFGPSQPNLDTVRRQAPATVNQPVPVLYDSSGHPTSQQYTEAQWQQFEQEATIWNWLADNPHHINADLAIQYRFADNSTWQPVYCTEGSGSDQETVVCGYNPVTWNLQASYYMSGDVMGPWLRLQLLGEVGMRTLGLSYASGRNQGTGVDFALAQKAFAQEYTNGFDTPEVPLMLDARAMQTPDFLAKAWAVLKAS